MKKTGIATILVSILTACFILSGSISVPILVRGLYYHQVESLGISETTGLSFETIKEAFDEMMDYCVAGGEGSGHEFGTGSLAWSQEGKDHFNDVAKLFVLDIRLLLVSGVLLVLAMAVGIKKKTYPRILGRGPLFWGPVILGLAFLGIGAVALVDFDSFFVKFHHLFFPGKSNWIFDPTRDEIINILPETVFRNFAILIVMLVLGLSMLALVVDFLLKRRGA